MPRVKDLIKLLSSQYKPNEFVAVAIWTTDDVYVALSDEIAERNTDIPVSLPPGAAEEIIKAIDDDQDADNGITWETIRRGIARWMDDHPQEQPCQP